MHNQKITKRKYNMNKSWGLLTSIDLHKCSPEIIRDSEKIKEFVYKLCNLMKVKRFGECIVVHFGEREDIAGFSMIQLIETSLISGHFANKTNNAYLDVFSCRYYDSKKVVKFAKKVFESKSLVIHQILRK